MMPYTPPEYLRNAFNCPHCGAYANQTWLNLYGLNVKKTQYGMGDFTSASCAHCNRFSVWVEDNLEHKMLYPDSSAAPLANADLPSDIRSDFEEARTIVSRSPRGAAALFRLCIQKLCVHLGEGGVNLNADIASLVKKGLNEKVQKSLDFVRVIGNEAVHPGTIDLRDKPETAVHLATLVNVIAEAMITQPKLVDNLYQSLPKEKKEQIAKRDRTS